MQKSLTELPEGYQLYATVNLQKNKKTAALVNGAALLIGVVMAVIMLFIVPIKSLYDTSDGWGMCFLRFGVMIFGMVAYMILHELVHGVVMKICGTKKVKYGFTGMYAYAGSTDYYGKGAYILIALAPIVLLGIVLGIVNAIVPVAWFWVVYFIQIINISGAAGDLYVTILFARMPKDILVQDAGTSMNVYAMDK